MGSYPGYRANVAKVMQDADRIIERLREIGTTLAVIKAEYRCSYALLYRAIFSRLTKEQWRAIAHQKLARGGVKTRFKKGHPTWNRGRKGTHFSPATEWKKGNRPWKYKPVGTIYIIKDKTGKRRRWIKLSDDGPRQDRRMPYARYLWQQQHGPIPPGYFVIHDNGDTLDDEADNLILVNTAGNAAHQLATNPRHLRKLRFRAGIAARLRHAKRRAEKIRGVCSSWYECTGCGEEYAQQPTPPCRKCGHLFFEKIEQPISMARRQATAALTA